MANDEKRIALLKDGLVYNIVVGPSVEDIATLFECNAIEVTAETLSAHLGYGFANGQFLQPPVEPDPVGPIEVIEADS